MLELRKGIASRNYENEFFRKLSYRLTELFVKKGWNGILIGMPESLKNQTLQIDCILVTNNLIVLIDFKKYSGKLTLPNKDKFKSGRWIINDRVSVKGGSSINPYNQLSRQRGKFIELLEGTISRINKKTINTMVCFHEPVNIKGDIPSEILGFSIADSDTVIDKLVDFIEVENGKQDYLSPRIKNLLIKKLFRAPIYSLSTPLEIVPEQTLSKKGILTDNNFEHYVTEINSFLKFENKIMIISGNVMSGKTSLIPEIREQAFDNDFAEVPVYAYSNRLKHKMLKNHPEIEEVQSLYASIFDFEKETYDNETFKKMIPLTDKGNIVMDDSDLHDLFIIDDGHLISNSLSTTDDLQFGTGYLLDDLFSFLQLDNHPNRKVIFLGDTNSISYGSSTENVMNEEYIKQYLSNKGIVTNINRLVLSPRSDASEIIDLCNSVANKINSDKFNELTITNSDEVSLLSKDETSSILLDTYNDPMNNKILSYTNEQTNRINKWIKEKLLRNGVNIGVGDHIVFDSSIMAIQIDDESNINEATIFNDSFVNLNRINSGTFGTIISIDAEENFLSDIDEEQINLSLIPCEVKISNSAVYKVYILGNYLQSKKGNLETIEIQSYHMLLNILLRKSTAFSKFKQSDEYKDMERKNIEILAKTGKPYYIINSKGEFRLSTNKRQLPQEVKSFRQRISMSLLSDPTTPYFKLYNAARVRYAWSMTVNKAMAYSFNNVHFNVEQDRNRGRNNKDYFKWLYTGFSIAENRLTLIKWRPISPFSKTRFNPRSNEKAPKEIIYTFSKVEEFKEYLKERLNDSEWNIVDIKSRNYLEIVIVQKKETILTLHFHYNSKGEVRAPIQINGSNQDLSEILKIIKKEPGYNEEFMLVSDFFIDFIKMCASKNIIVTIKATRPWNIFLDFIKYDESMVVHCVYNGDGLISYFNLVEGSLELFSEVKKIIREKYLL